MGKIRVDHGNFETAANSIEEYIRKTDSLMGKADNAITNMKGSYSGEDATAFVNNWNSVNDGGSTYCKMKESLENYAGFLRNAGNSYKRAQADAINRAWKLPRW